VPRKKLNDVDASSVPANDIDIKVSGMLLARCALENPGITS
jgi:hypothetical protein